MTKLFLFIFFILIRSFSFVTAQSLEINLDSMIKAHQIPAMGVAVITSQEIESYFAGTISNESEVKVDTNSKWHMGSCTKAVTSLLAARLVEEEKLDFDATLAKTVPELKRHMRKEFKKVTLADLLSHRAGIPPFTTLLEFSFLPEFKGAPTEKRMQFAKRLVGKPPYPSNGEVYTYSNAGYSLAALMLETASGKSWETLVAELFQDQGWEYHVGFPNWADPNHPWGHQLSPEGSYRPTPPNADYHLQDFIAPAGDLSMTLPDYAALIQLHLKGLQGEDNLVSAESYRKLHYGRDAYAFGWLNHKSDSGVQYSEHDGTVGTYYCHAKLIPDRNFAVVFFMNIVTKEAIQGMYKVEEKILSARP